MPIRIQPNWLKPAMIRRVFAYGHFPKSARLGSIQPLVFRKFYRVNQEYERKKYDRLLQQLISNVNNTHGDISRLQIPPASFAKKKLPVKTVIILIIASSSLTMVLYVLSQLLKFNEDNEQSKQVFLPLWFKSHWFGSSKYQFPVAISYFGDYEYYEYLLTELAQLNQKNLGTISDVENYQSLLQTENVKYTLLEKLSGNFQIRKIFGLPLTIKDPQDFSMWIESKHPTVSGISVNFFSPPSENTNGTPSESKSSFGSTKISFSWLIKLIKVGNIVNDVLISLGLKLNHLDSEQIKIHEKSSGKIHEVPIEDKKITLNSNKDYVIKYLGKYTISDINKVEQGTLIYSGIIDFDHIMINRGIKITSIDLIKQQGQEKVKYKIL